MDAFYPRSAVFHPQVILFHLNYLDLPRSLCLKLFCYHYCYLPMFLSQSLDQMLSLRGPSSDFHSSFTEPGLLVTMPSSVLSENGEYLTSPHPPIPCPAKTRPCWMVTGPQIGAVGQLEPTPCFVASFWKALLHPCGKGLLTLRAPCQGEDEPQDSVGLAGDRIPEANIQMKKTGM